MKHLRLSVWPLRGNWRETGSGHNKGITKRDNAPDKPVIIMLLRQAQLGASYRVPVSDVGNTVRLYEANNTEEPCARKPHAGICERSVG
jgi:hypothetical protein